MNRALENCNNVEASINSLEDIYVIIAPKTWMFVCGIEDKYIPKEIISFYNNHKDNCVKFTKFSPNPKSEEVDEGKKLFVTNECSLIIALGGGSAIDVAKCIKYYSSYDNNGVLESNVNFIAIPTTAGTGSESTSFAVIYENGTKQSLSNKIMLPDLYMFVPDLLFQLPIRIKKSTFLDALCHAIESYWSKKSNDESKKWSQVAIIKLLENLMDYFSENNNIMVSKEMFIAANAAGKAINITTTTAAHALSYKLTSLYGIPHGEAVALCLPYIWKINKCEIPNITLEMYENILREFNIEKPISLHKNEDINVLIDSVNVERLSNNPVEINKEQIRKIYEEIINEN